MLHEPLLQAILGKPWERVVNQLVFHEMGKEGILNGSLVFNEMGNNKNGD